MHLAKITIFGYDWLYRVLSKHHLNLKYFSARFLVSVMCLRVRLKLIRDLMDDGRTQPVLSFLLLL